jgi:hypothetical protein
MQCTSTNLVYWNEDIGMKEITSSNKSIFSKMYIPKDTILLIEHVFCDNSKDISLKYILDAIRFSSKLYESLYPRNKSWNITDTLHPSKEDNELLIEKLKCNGFMKNGNVYIGEYVTKSNHSFNYNAKAFVFDMKDTKEEFPISYIAVISTQDIQCDKEIYIKYNDTIKFDENKNENSLQPFKMNSVTKQECLQKIHTYQTTDSFYFCRTQQIGIYYGIFCYEESIFFNNTFDEYIENLNIKNNLKNRQLWFENIYNKYSN